MVETPTGGDLALTTVRGVRSSCDTLATKMLRITSTRWASVTHSRIAHHAWARLLARIDEVFPLVCPRCGGERRIIAFIPDAAAVRDILTHLGEPTSPPRRMRARALPLWERQGATLGEDEAQPQPVPDYESDQRIAG